MNKHQETIALVAPYAVWMASMMLLPATGWAYAVRSAATLACLALGWILWRRAGGKIVMPGAMDILVGAAAGLAVWAIWVLPEDFSWYQRLFVAGCDGTTTATASPSPYEPAVCGWPLTLARLAGSAFVISAAEELFFRKWLYEWLGGRESRSAFFWMLALFAVEHNRWLVAIVAGAVYGILAIRRSLGTAIIAHAVTNLVLGIQVIATGNWNFW